jgi:DNA mismatch repair protein MutS
VLEKLREEEAIEAKGGGGSSGGTKQVVFDVGSGQIKTGDRGISGGRGTTEEGGTAEESDDGPEPPGDAIREQFGDDAEAVLEEIADLSVGNTAPVELLNRAQEWQERLEGDDD